QRSIASLANTGGNVATKAAHGPGSTAVPPTPTPTPSTIRPFAVATARPVAKGPIIPSRKQGTPDPSPTTDHVIVVDGTSGEILFQRNAFEPIAPSSLTKIMTAILGIEHGPLSNFVPIDVNARDFSDSTVMGLEPGLHLTMRDLLYGLMLPSGNDAAVAIARYVAGNEDTFVWLMNVKAKELGLHCTHFANPHGLDNPDHYSCPADMVTMARYGMQYEEFQKLAAAKTYDIRQDNISYTVSNLNPLLWSYPGADGVKIGYTDNSGRSMVASATKNGHRVYVAFMRSEAGLGPETTALMDWAFSSFDWGSPN
ncbi:MAG TPA: D-alanyl-D-alanine carboxypeptidase family protein, partial [Chloroflexota bacterium]|nr:D-alanyl-D-alanine carboxypeptidase family protein [Chloroflexota bacterium]